MNILQLHLLQKLNTKNKKTKKNHTHEEALKILTSKQMLQRLPIPVAQVKAGFISENLLINIRQIICSLYQAKEITKKFYNSKGML